MTWNQETALRELEFLVNEIEELKAVPRSSAPHMRWLVRVLRFLEEVFGRRSRYYVSISRTKWGYSGSAFLSLRNQQAEKEYLHQMAYVDKLDSAKGILQAAMDELQVSDISAVYSGKDTPPESSTIVRVMNLIERKLRKLIREQPKKERAVQDSIENLFIGADIEHGRETDSIEYSSKTYIPDFTLKKLDLAIEVKLCNREGREKEIIAEINDDIQAYGTKYGNMMFVVYDLGFIRDVERFADAFEENMGVVVRVVKH